jgi:hypothetical protein
VGLASLLVGGGRKAVVIARSGATKQSRQDSPGGLLRYARNDGVARNDGRGRE